MPRGSQETEIHEAFSGDSIAEPCSRFQNFGLRDTRHSPHHLIVNARTLSFDIHNTGFLLFDKSTVLQATSVPYAKLV
ncbi:MAG: hypothetical protein ACJAYI_001190 [Myxococcota bacterium]|jgi:hypothetical protein